MANKNYSNNTHNEVKPPSAGQKTLSYVSSHSSAIFKFVGILIFLVFFSVLLSSAMDDLVSPDSSTTFEQYHESNMTSGAVHIESILKNLSGTVASDWSDNFNRISNFALSGNWGPLNFLKKIVTPLFTIVEFVYSGFIALFELIYGISKLLIT